MSISGHVLGCLLHIFGVGEITASVSGNTIHLHQVSKLVNDKQEVEAIKVTFLNYKHNFNQSCFSLVVSRQSTCCPVQHLLTYLQARGHSPGSLFQMPDGSPAPLSIFTEKLSTALKYCVLDPSKYKGHSFCIGAATHAADKGMSDAQIRESSIVNGPFLLVHGSRKWHLSRWRVL